MRNTTDNKQVNDERVARIRLYYQDKDFLAWVTSHDFQHINADTVSRYFSLYQQFRMCERKECAACSGSRNIWESEEDIVLGRFKYRRCNLREDEAAKQRADAMLCTAIPPAFRNIEWKDLPGIDGDAANAIQNYLQVFPENNPLGLYIYSKKHGAGRTALLWLLVKELLKLRKITSFVLHTAAMFIDELQKDQFTEKHLFSEKAQTCSLLALDDFGRGKETGAWSGKIEGLLEERTWLRKPIIMSSMIPLEGWTWTTTAEESLFSKIQRNMKYICIRK